MQKNDQKKKLKIIKLDSINKKRKRKVKFSYKKSFEEYKKNMPTIK